MTCNCLSLLETLFLTVNVAERRIETEAEGDSNLGKRGGNAGVRPIEILHADLLGFEILWAIALDAEDAKVGKRAVSFLVRLIRAFSSERLGTEAEKRRGLFTRHCVNALEANAQVLGGGEASEAGAASRRIRRCLSLLLEFVDEPAKVDEKRDSLGFPTGPRKHGACVIIGQARIEVALRSSETIKTLRAKVWHKMGGAGSAVEEPSMLRMIAGGRELKNESVTLAEIVHVMKRAPLPPPLHVGGTRRGDTSPFLLHRRNTGGGGGGGSGGSGSGNGNGSESGGASSAGPAMEVDTDSRIPPDSPRALPAPLPALTPTRALVVTAGNLDVFFRLLSLGDSAVRTIYHSKWLT
ncbi:hypothetical protein T492DRAFT_845335 [Pavlovales sp. CCMP2436]|nr:hypothetical protein T492DRAFT_845335 [Pavlovales sp. CCMP2436]